MSGGRSTSICNSTLHRRPLFYSAHIFDWIGQPHKTGLGLTSHARIRGSPSSIPNGRLFWVLVWKTREMVVPRSDCRGTLVLFPLTRTVAIGASYKMPPIIRGIFLFRFMPQIAKPLFFVVTLHRDPACTFTVSETNGCSIRSRYTERLISICECNDLSSLHGECQRLYASRSVIPALTATRTNAFC